MRGFFTWYVNLRSSHSLLLYQAVLAPSVLLPYLLMSCEPHLGTKGSEKGRPTKPEWVAGTLYIITTSEEKLVDPQSLGKHCILPINICLSHRTVLDSSSVVFH